MPVARADVTGLVLAGGRGVRMGDVDKGLQPFGNRTLVERAIERLAPQVGSVIVSANRSLDRYAALGHRVVADVDPGHPGPLAGFHAGLLACDTRYLMSVPCDAPFLPGDLVAMLAAVFDDDEVELAVARTPERMHPVVCLMRTTLVDGVVRQMRSADRSAASWIATTTFRVVSFADETAFRNVNTPEELRSAEAALPRR